jgi:hypothetical protein
MIEKVWLHTVRWITYTFICPTIWGLLLGLSPHAVMIAKGSDFCMIPPIFCRLLVLKESWNRVIVGTNNSLSSLLIVGKEISKLLSHHGERECWLMEE